MHINISTLLEFKKLKSLFRGASEFNVVVNESSVSVIVTPGSLAKITTFPADVVSDTALPLGFSFFSTLLLNLPIKSKGLDEFNIAIKQSSVAITLNGRTINVYFTLYNPGTLLNVDDRITPVKFAVKEIAWLLDVSKFYRYENIQIINNYAIIDTEDGIYFSPFSNLSGKNFSFAPSLLNKANAEVEVFLSNKLEVRNKSYRIFSQLYKASATLGETVAFAHKQKAKIKTTLALKSQSKVMKRLKASTFKSDLASSVVVITTKDNEQLLLPYDSVNTDVATNDFGKLTSMSEMVSTVNIHGYPLHQLISNEKSVEVLITPYASLFKFADNCYFILKERL